MNEINFEYDIKRVRPIVSEKIKHCKKEILDAFNETSFCVKKWQKNEDFSGIFTLFYLPFSDNSIVFGCNLDFVEISIDYFYCKKMTVITNEIIRSAMDVLDNLDALNELMGKVKETDCPLAQTINEIESFMDIKVYKIISNFFEDISDLNEDEENLFYSSLEQIENELVEEDSV